jgi:hypothetical protein
MHYYQEPDGSYLAVKPNTLENGLYEGLMFKEIVMSVSILKIWLNKCDRVSSKKVPRSIIKQFREYREEEFFYNFI